MRDFWISTCGRGVERWGHPISEALVENGVLCQYFQRGVLEWTPVANGFALTRRLAWDYLGGGLDGSPDLGVEAGVSNPHDGRFEGPFGHKVSNADVIGTPTAFLDFFDRLGGAASFGFPKREARLDTGAAGTLFAPGRAPDSSGSTSRPRLWSRTLVRVIPSGCVYWATTCATGPIRALDDDSQFCGLAAVDRGRPGQSRSRRALVRPDRHRRSGRVRRLEDRAFRRDRRPRPAGRVGVSPGRPAVRLFLEQHHCEHARHHR